MGPSPVLRDLLATQARVQAVRMTLLTLASLVVLVGVVLFAADMVERAAQSPLGSPTRGYLCGGLCGLPCVVLAVLGAITAYQQRGGGPDLRHLERHWVDISGASKRAVTYTMKGNAVADTQHLVVTFRSGEPIELAVRSRDVDRILVQLQAELAMR